MIVANLTTTALPVAGTILAALIAATVTYLLAVRKASGRIGSSEAADLWHASEQIRKDLREDLVLVRSEMVRRDAECDAKIAKLETRIMLLQEQLA